MFKIKYEPQFKKDYKRFRHKHPELVKDFRNTLNQLITTGKVGVGYNLHPLNKKGGKYSGHFYYHLSDGKIDVVVIYKPHKTNPQIRLVRIGSYAELFGGKEK